MDLDLLLNSPVTVALLVANIVLSIWGFNSPRLIDATLFDMRRVRQQHQYQRLITSGFVHGDPLHLFVNMLTLFFFGPIMEQVMGATPYVAVYFACLLSGSLWTMVEHHRNLGYKALGASGAISGIITAFALFAPFSMINVFFILPLPAIVFAVLYIVWSGWAQGRLNDNVGHAAHLGGALMGVALVCLFWPEAIESTWRQVLRFFQV
jgi:membrane associated rhomboid family serine protease